MNTLDFIAKKYSLDLKGNSPIDINVSRNELGTLFNELDFVKGAEIGVERGIYSEILCRANPKLLLYCIDPWKAYRGYREHTTQITIDRLYTEALKRLLPYNCKIIREFSEKAHELFDNESLDFVYIDGNHDFFHTTRDLINWVPKVKKGGIVSGHDFVSYKGKYGQYNQVKKAVTKYVGDEKIAPLFKLKSSDERSSWMWVKK